MLFKQTVISGAQQADLILHNFEYFIKLLRKCSNPYFSEKLVEVGSCTLCFLIKRVCLN